MVSITTSDTEDLTHLSGLYTGLYFWSNAAAPSRTDTATTGTDGAKNLLYELTTITKTVVGSELIITYSVPLAVEWPHSVVNGGGATTTSIPLDSAAGFSVRDKIQVKTAGGFQTPAITAIVSNTLTVTPMAVAPGNDIEVQVLCCQVGVKKNTAAGISDIQQDEGYFKEAGIACTGTIRIPLRRV